MSADVIQEVTVVGYNDDCTEVLRKELLEPAYRVYVKVVCRLVKENDVGIAEKSLCKQHLYLFVTRKGRHLRIEYILGKSETLYEL